METVPQVAHWAAGATSGYTGAMIVWSLLGCGSPPPAGPAPSGPAECSSLWAAYTAFQHGVSCAEPTGVEPVDPTFGCPADLPVNACADLRFDDPQVPPWDPVAAPHERIYVDACPDPDGCDVTELARCTDGTRPAIYLGRAPEGSAFPDSWVIHFDGAGRPCGGHDPCLGVYRAGAAVLNAAALSSSHAGRATWPGHVSRQGILAHTENNAFSTFNRVSFDRCVSASQGTSRRVFDPLPAGEGGPGATVEVFYRSDQVFRSTLATLLDEGLAEAEHVVLTGGSDGARWLVHAVDRYADMVREVAPEAAVSAVFDSNFRPMMAGEAFHAEQSCGSGPAGTTFWTADYHNRDGLEVVCDDPTRRYAYSPANFSAAGPGGGPGVIHLEFESYRILEDESCLATHAAAPEPGLYCRNALHVLTNHVQTPYFVLGRLADEKSRAADWLVIEDEGEAFFTADETRTRVRRQAIDLVEGWSTEGEEARHPGARVPGVLLKEGDGHTFLLSGSFHTSIVADCGSREVFEVGDSVLRWVVEPEPVVLIDGYRDVVTDPLQCL